MFIWSKETFAQVKTFSPVRNGTQGIMSVIVCSIVLKTAENLVALSRQEDKKNTSHELITLLSGCTRVFYERNNLLVTFEESTQP